MFHTPPRYEPLARSTPCSVPPLMQFSPGSPIGNAPCSPPPVQFSPCGRPPTPGSPGVDWSNWSGSALEAAQGNYTGSVFHTPPRYEPLARSTPCSAPPLMQFSPGSPVGNAPSSPHLIQFSPARPPTPGSPGVDWSNWSGSALEAAQGNYTGSVFHTPPRYEPLARSTPCSAPPLMQFSPGSPQGRAPPSPPTVQFSPLGQPCTPQRAPQSPNLIQFSPGSPNLMQFSPGPPKCPQSPNLIQFSPGPPRPQQPDGNPCANNFIANMTGTNLSENTSSKQSPAGDADMTGSSLSSSAPPLVSSSSEGEAASPPPPASPPRADASLNISSPATSSGQPSVPSARFTPSIWSSPDGSVNISISSSCSSPGGAAAACPEQSSDGGRGGPKIVLTINTNNCQRANAAAPSTNPCPGRIRPPPGITPLTPLGPRPSQRQLCGQAYAGFAPPTTRATPAGPPYGSPCAPNNASANSWPSPLERPCVRTLPPNAPPSWNLVPDMCGSYISRAPYSPGQQTLNTNVTGVSSYFSNPESIQSSVAERNRNQPCPNFSNMTGGAISEGSSGVGIQLSSFGQSGCTPCTMSGSSQPFAPGQTVYTNVTGVSSYWSNPESLERSSLVQPKRNRPCPNFSNVTDGAMTDVGMQLSAYGHSDCTPPGTESSYNSSNSSRPPPGTETSYNSSNSSRPPTSSGGSSNQPSQNSTGVSDSQWRFNTLGLSGASPDGSCVGSQPGSSITSAGAGGPPSMNRDISGISNTGAPMSLRSCPPCLNDSSIRSSEFGSDYTSYQSQLGGCSSLGPPSPGNNATFQVAEVQQPAQNNLTFIEAGAHYGPDCYDMNLSGDSLRGIGPPQFASSPKPPLNETY